MCIHDIYISKVEALERRLETLDDVFPRKTVVVDEDLAINGTPIDLCKPRLAIECIHVPCGASHSS